jgi:endonuclease YncB( thermonuclease family)
MRLLVAAFAALLGFSATAAELEGLVTDVQDGDSITLAKLSESYRVRLLDIDAPELKQPFGIESRASLREVCLFKRATINTKGEDRFGRTLARVKCAGVDANAEQVRRGMAWVFVRYAPKGSPLYEVQTEAKSARRGLWVDSKPIAPWEWRSNGR